MKTYKLKDFVVPIAVSVTDPANSGYDKFVGLEHYDSGELVVSRYSGVELLTTTAKAFVANDILVARRNVYLRRAGVVYFDGITSGDSIVLRVREDCEKVTGVNRELAQRVLPLVVNSDAFWIYANKHADGMNSKRVSKDTLMDYEFDLPSLDEQKVLADKLWAAYRVKESYRKLLAATDDMIKAKFIKMVLDKDWSTEKLPNIATYCIGLTYKPADVCDDGVVVLRSGNIQNAQIDLSDIVRVSTKIRENLFVHENDILMCSRNGSAQLVGKTALIPKLDEPMTYGAFMTVIRSDYNRYLALYFQTDAFRKQLSGAKSSVMNQVTQKMLDEIIVPIPDSQTIDELTRIATQAEATKASLRRSIESIDCVIKSLINQ